MSCRCPMFLPANGATLPSSLGSMRIKCTTNPNRSKYNGIQSVKDLAHFIQSRKNIVALCGAGISVSCGVPDFRSEGGLYDIIGDLGLGLPQPECLFDLEYFRDEPQAFYTFASRLLPKNEEKSFSPSVTHRFLKALHLNKKLLRIYTQNIDGIEALAGIPNKEIVKCHGTLETARCLTCKKKYTLKDIRASITNGIVPYCEKAHRRTGRRCGGVIKPDVTFFGEPVHPMVNKLLHKDYEKIDMLLVIGTSLSVAPISEIVQYFPAHISRILINREPVSPRKQSNRPWSGFNVEMLGFCDTVISSLVVELGWSKLPCFVEGDGKLSEHTNSRTTSGNPRFVFEGGREGSAKETSQKEFTVEFVCDGCGNKLKPNEKRTCCRVCWDYDLCPKCAASGDAGNRHIKSFGNKHIVDVLKDSV
ncbi:hypothetical protein AAMO2058_001345200 [Amorphochlora amoebiformis]